MENIKESLGNPRAAWLKSNISAPDLRIIDASWFPSWIASANAGRAAYERGHIPGAVYFDIDDICAEESDLPHMMPDSVKFSSRVRKLGVGDGNRIVVGSPYNDSNGENAGLVCAYQLNGDTWVQLGRDIVKRRAFKTLIVEQFGPG